MLTTEHSKKSFLRLKNGLNKILIYTLISSTILTPQGYGKKFEYTFTEDIYNQSSILTKYPSSHNLSAEQNKRLDEELAAELLRRKEEEVYASSIVTINKSIKRLEEELKEVSKGQFKKNLIEGLKGAAETAPYVGVIGGGALGPAGPIGAVAGYGIGVLAGGVASFLLKEYGDRSFSHQADPKIIAQEMRELEKESFNLTEALKTEPIAPLEKEYIKKKRTITNKKLIKEIETGLIQARKSNFLTDLTTQFIGLALNLPVTQKKLFDSTNPFESRKRIQDDFEKNTFFRAFEGEVKKNLKDIITDVAIDSIAPDDSPELPLRKTYYFYGDPSSGKTSAAKEIARFLNLPYYETSIRSIAELSPEKLEGADRLRGDPNVGWLANPLFQATEGEHKTYKNGFLIINDFDRVLFDSTQATTALATLLDYLDPGKKEFHSPYFGAPLDIRRLNIIITSNTEIKEKSEEKSEEKKESSSLWSGLWNMIPSTDYITKWLPKKAIQDPVTQDPSSKKDNLEALRSRFTKHIYFPRLSAESIKTLMAPVLEEATSRHFVPDFLKFEYVDPTQLKLSYNLELLRSFGFKEEDLTSRSQPIKTGINENVIFRELKSGVNSFINHYMNQMTGEGQAFYEAGEAQFIHNCFIKDRYEVAALRGHPIALWILKKLKENHPTAARLDLLKSARWPAFYEALNEGDLNERNKEILTFLPEYLQDAPETLKMQARLAFNQAGERMMDTNPTDASTCFMSAFSLGCVEAREGLYRLAEKLETKKGLGNAQSKEYYDAAPLKNHGMALFKLGWLAWNEDNFEEAEKRATESAKENCGWGHWLHGNIYARKAQMAQDGCCVPSVFGNDNIEEKKALMSLALKQYKLAYNSKGNLKPFAALKVLSLLKTYENHTIFPTLFKGVSQDFPSYKEFKAVVQGSLKEKKNYFAKRNIEGSSESSIPFFGGVLEEYNFMEEATWSQIDDVSKWNSVKLSWASDEDKALVKIVFPPRFIQDEVTREMESLQNIRNTIQSLISNDDDQTQISTSIRNLLGTSSTSYGYIEYLWTTKGWPWNQLSNKDLNALFNRMGQFNTPNQKYDVLRFHIQLAQVVTDVLVNKFTKNGKMHEEILHNAYQKNNIQKLISHLDLLNQNQLGKEDSPEEEKKLIQSYKQWLDVQGSGSKIDLLKKLYSIE